MNRELFGVAVSYARRCSRTHHVADVHRPPETFRDALAGEPDRGQ